MSTTKKTVASKLDTIVRTIGDWDVLVKKAQTASNKMGFTTKFTKGYLRSHINYRVKTQKKADFMGNLEMTETGIAEKVAQ
jgi:hypothetical protein